jgi:hypothetical protein
VTSFSNWQFLSWSRNSLLLRNRSSLHPPLDHLDPVHAPTTHYTRRRTSIQFMPLQLITPAAGPLQSSSRPYNSLNPPLDHFNPIHTLTTHYIRRRTTSIQFTPLQLISLRSILRYFPFHVSISQVMSFLQRFQPKLFTHFLLPFMSHLFHRIFNHSINSYITCAAENALLIEEETNKCKKLQCKRNTTGSCVVRYMVKGVLYVCLDTVNINENHWLTREADATAWLTSAYGSNTCAVFRAIAVYIGCQEEDGQGRSGHVSAVAAPSGVKPISLSVCSHKQSSGDRIMAV